MRNGSLVVILLALVLLLGLLGGGYLLLRDEGEPRRHGNSIAIDGPETDATPKVNVGNTSKPEPQPTPTPDPKPEPKPDPKPDPLPKPEPQPEPKPDDPPKANWKTKEVEITVTGTVHYKNDNRPAVGVSVSAINSEADVYGRWGDSDWAKSMRERPLANPKGSTNTDGEGKFTLKLTVTASNGGEFGSRRGSSGGDGEDRPAEPVYLATFSLVATEPGYAPARSAQLNVAAGDIANVAMILAHPAAVRGRVVDGASRKGIGGAWVEFHNTERQDRTGWVEPRRVVTGEDGYFAVNDLPEARYGVSVGAQSYANQDYWQTRRFADLTAGSEKDLGDIALNQTVSIKGRVLDAQTKKPLKATVSAEKKSSGRWGGGSQPAQSAEDGTFTITGVEPGPWEVSAQAEGYAKSSVEVTVAAGENANAGDILLGPGVAISGRVVDSARRPKPGVEVVLSEVMDAGPFFGGWPNERSRTKTDEEGRFRLSGLSEGKWQLGVTVEGFAPLVHPFEIKDAPLEVELVLLVGGSVRGVVRDARGGAVENATVMMLAHGSPGHELYKVTGQFERGLGLGNNPTAETDASGQFTFSHVPPGTYLVGATDGKGGQAFKDEVAVRDGGSVDNIELVIAPKGALEITVLEDGKPIPNITLTLWRGFMPMQGVTATSGENGVALMSEVPEGSYTLRTSRDDVELDTDIIKRRAVQVKAGETTRFTLELKPQSGARLFGTLTMNGRNDFFSTVVLVGVGPLKSVIKQGPVRNGQYEFRALAKGKYELHARQTQESVPATVVVEVGEDGDVPFSKDFRGYVVSGTVTTPANTGAERSAVKIVITSAGASSPENTFWMRGDAACDNEGQYSLENVAPGTYLLTASLTGVGSVSKEVTVTNGDATVDMSIGKTSGQVALKITKLNGKAIRQGMGFALPALTDSAGRNVPLGDPNESFMTVSEGSERVLATIPAGSYTATVRAMGFLAKSVANVTVEVGKTTTVEFELTAAAELRVTFTNTDVTQEQCDSATITYWDASGKQVPVESNIFDSFGTPPAFPKPTVAAQYLGADVAQVKIKLAGFAEVTVPVAFEAGKLITSEVTLTQG